MLQQQGGHQYHHHATQNSGWGHLPHVPYTVRSSSAASSSSCWSLYRRPIGIVISILLTILLILVASFLALHFTALSSSTKSKSLEAAPTDTRVIPMMPGTYCQAMQLSVSGTISVGYIASLYVLDSPPVLTGYESFSLDTTTTVVNNLVYPYYMYPGSHITVSGCVCDDSYDSGSFYLMKGDPDTGSSVGSYLSIDTACSSGSNDSQPYHIDYEDYYYLKFFGMNHDLKLHVEFFRTSYELPSNASANDSCSMYTGFYDQSCYVSVPFSYDNKTAFLSIVPDVSTDVDMTQQLNLEVKCVPRIWMYAVIVLSCLIGVLLIMVPLSACIIKCCKKKSSPAVIATSAESASAPLLTASPHLQQPQPQYGYGSNYVSYEQ